MFGVSTTSALLLVLLYGDFTLHDNLVALITFLYRHFQILSPFDFSPHILTCHIHYKKQLITLLFYHNTYIK